MELRSSQIGTSTDGGLGPQNPLTRKMKPVLLITVLLQPVQRPACLGLQATFARILIFPQKIFRSYQKG
jgi:hypothetical protein